MFSYEYCEIFKNTYLEEHLRTAASASVFNKNKCEFAAAKLFLKKGLKIDEKVKFFLSKLVGLLVWWPTFPWSGKQQFLFLKTLPASCCPNEYK